MLDSEACRRRTLRFAELAGIGSRPGAPDAALLTAPEHLLYFANVFPQPAGLNLHSRSFLLIHKGGATSLFADNWMGPPSGGAVDEVVVADWYTMKSPARDRALAVAEAVIERLRRLGVRVLGVEAGALPAAVARAAPEIADLEPRIHEMREAKDEDELRAIQAAIGAAEAAHRASREAALPGTREIDLFAHVHAAATREAARPLVFMCDIVSGDRALAGSGQPTARPMREGELVILDFFPYLDGYRGDITNTLAVGKEPSAAQEDAFSLAAEALKSAEEILEPGVPVTEVFRAMDRVLRRPGDGWSLRHHGGHGIGLGHPEAPHIVPESDRRLAEGMVIALEPGAYHQSFGGVRIEHDYLITRQGFRRLSSHELGLK